MVTKNNKSEIEIKEFCPECEYLKDMTNIKPALCNFHQGFQSGILKAKDEIIKMIDESGTFAIIGKSDKEYIRGRKELAEELTQKISKEIKDVS